MPEVSLASKALLANFAACRGNDFGMLGIFKNMVLLSPIPKVRIDWEFNLSLRKS
jgi:hypothetical protein